MKNTFDSPLNKISNDAENLRIFTGHLAKKIHNFHPQIDLEECAGWAQLGLTQALNQFDVRRVGNNQDKNVLYRYIINTGYMRALDSMRSANVIGRIRKGRRYGGTVNAVNESCMSDYHSLDTIADPHSPNQKDLVLDIQNVINGRAKLTPREREVITLHFFQGKDFTTIAQTLHVSTGRAYTLSSRALRKIGEHIDDPESPLA